MEPVTLPFGVFSALTGAAAYGLVRFFYDLTGSDDPNAVRGLRKEDFMEVAKGLQELCLRSQKGLHIVE